VEFSQERGPDRPYYSRPLWDISREALCKEALLQLVVPPRSAIEFFGGLGVGATILRELYHPSPHMLFDTDGDCCGHLHRNHFAVVRADSLQQNSPASDLADADFDRFTASKIKNDSSGRKFIESLFTVGHRQIIVTDVAVAKFHLNYQYYEVLLRRALTSFQDYLAGFSDIIHHRYGYSLTAVEYHSGAAYLLWEEGQHPLSHFNRTQANYAGVALV
jgi:hypothetical protein